MRRKLSTALFLVLAALTVGLGGARGADDDKGGGTGANKGAPNSQDPNYINAQANYLTAVAKKQEADIKAFLAWSEAELNWAKAAHEWATARYLETLRGILIQEYNEILVQQRRIQTLIAELRNNQYLMERIRLGRTDEYAFRAMIRLMATSLEFDPIRDAFNRKVELLAKTNFKSNDSADDTALPLVDFPGGDVRKLLIFVKEHNFSFVPLYDAHFIVMDALSVISKSAADRILRHEQEIQAVRASRIAEAFQLPN